ncbi:ATP-binding cassette domain-containing protein [Rubrivirga sp. S365]|uniref:ATP-binding cassette domain-containing protein n=1 Tax=Rubrivirga sp. S365 TaxID=3076080 RepID=UPI0028C7F204|nr:ATP-binding cassette domain-containing protein [Rubrivirga sp. S365]MDT7857811.1 ATP-binding cassette domain-containing protein [Rubrivirga sp. S365]
MIQLHGVAKRYGPTVALHPTSLAVGRGDVLALLGTSGSGKSTLLRAVLRLVVPDAGTVAVDGVEVTDATALEVRRRAGYVIQGGGLFPHLTARGNAGLLPRHLGWSDARLDTRLAELAELARLAPDTLGRFPAELSGGQRQRVALLRALVLSPDVLLLDEPLGALDPVTRDGLQRDLAGIVADLGTTVLLVTHDLREAAVLADRVAVMDGGRIVQRGRLEEIADAPATPFVQAFVEAQRYALP